MTNWHPILLCNVFKFTYINISAAVVTELSKHQNIIGIKQSSGNGNPIGQYVSSADRDFSVLLGYFGGDFRLPLLPASAKERTEISKMLQDAELLR